MKTEFACRYNENVICSKARRWKKCGWNPRVAEARRKKARRRTVYREDKHGKTEDNV